MTRNNYEDLPVGFGMALSQNVYAMEYFASLPKPKQRAIVEQARYISSKSEMHNYVNSLIQH